MFTKSDLKDGDVVTHRNGSKTIFTQNEFRELGSNDIIGNNFTKDLIATLQNEYDIVKIERPCQYKKVYERKETEELTIAQAEKKFEQLGLNIKII